MKLKDCKVGMKVKLPKTKCGKDMSQIAYSAVMNMANRMNQDYLYITGIEKQVGIRKSYSVKTLVICNEVLHLVHGDYFIADDLEPYVE